MLPRRGQGGRQLIAELLCQRELAGRRRRERRHGLHELIDRGVLQDVAVGRTQSVQLPVTRHVPAVDRQPLGCADDVDQQVVAAVARGRSSGSGHRHRR